jgi:hypothetical protein
MRVGSRGWYSHLSEKKNPVVKQAHFDVLQLHNV